MVYRQRMQTATGWVRELGLAPGRAALDVGCGAGLMSAELVRSGFSVTGTDSSPRMLQTASMLVAEQGLAEQVVLRHADAHRLPFADGEFELVVALGLLPWLHDAAAAVTELARVLAPGGWMILTADNRHRLNRLVEPRENPLLVPLKRLKGTLARSPRNGSQSAQSYRHLPREVDEMLSRAGITVSRRATVGYGPFTILGRPILPDGIGLRLNERLARAALGRRRLRGAGWHYVVAGLKAPVGTHRPASH